MKLKLMAGIGLIAALPSISQAKAPAQDGAIVMTGGRVLTPTGWQSAVAFRDGKIIAVGSDANVRRKAGRNAKRIDLGGRTVFPGLHDMHVHPFSAGSLLVQCKFEHGASPQQILDLIATCAKAKNPGEWIEGGSWQAISFGSTPPTREMLDKVSPNNPIMLRDISGHSAWVNSLALKLGGITRDTVAPEGGIIERDAAGEPTGVVRESALSVLRKAIPVASVKTNADTIERALSILVANGITTATDAGVTQDMADAYKLLSDEGRLQPRVRACLLYGKLWRGSGSFEILFANREKYRLPHLTPDCVKFLVDGVPTESHTAAMLEPYVDGHGAPLAGGERGTLQVPQPELDMMVRRIDQLGLVGKFHAAGDGSAKAVLDAVAGARKANGEGGPRHDIAHTTFISKADIARAKSLNVTLEFSPYIWSPTVINDDITKAVGIERMERAWPVREAIDAGAHVDVGSDWPAGTPTVSPWFAMETLVTRSVVDGSRSDRLGPKQATTLADAVRMFTVDGARQMGTLETSGSIDVGKNADLIVLDRNPFDIPITDVHNVVVLKTIIGGATVYEKK